MINHSAKLITQQMYIQYLSKNIKKTTGLLCSNTFIYMQIVDLQIATKWFVKIRDLTCDSFAFSNSHLWMCFRSITSKCICIFVFSDIFFTAFCFILKNGNTWHHLHLISLLMSHYKYHTRTINIIEVTNPIYTVPVDLKHTNL